MKKDYRVPTVTRPEDLIGNSSQPHAPFTLGTVNLPPCNDRLPDGVDLSIVDNIPKQRTASVSFCFVFMRISGDIRYYVGLPSPCLDGASS